MAGTKAATEVKTIGYDRGDVARFFVSGNTTTDDREWVREQWLGQDATRCWFRDSPRLRALIEPFHVRAERRP
jgi:hypothetical protein